MEGNFSENENSKTINAEMINFIQTTKTASINNNEKINLISDFSSKLNKSELESFPLIYENAEEKYNDEKTIIKGFNPNLISNNSNGKELINKYSDKIYKIKEEELNYNNYSNNKNQNDDFDIINEKNKFKSNKENGNNNSNNSINNNTNNYNLELISSNLNQINDEEIIQKKNYTLNNLDKNIEKKLVQKKLKYLYKRIDSCSSLLWSHDNHITGKRLRSENDHEDNKTNWKNRETTQTGYGEIALGSMTSLLNLFQNISKIIEYNSQKFPEFESYLICEPSEYNMTNDSSFLDIGSGFGKPVFHSALQVGCYSKGVEVVPARVEFCLDFFYEYLNEKNVFAEIEEKFINELNTCNSINNCKKEKFNLAEFENNETINDNNQTVNGKVNDSNLDKEDYEMNLNLNLDENEVDNAKMLVDAQSVSSENSRSCKEKINKQQSNLKNDEKSANNNFNNLDSIPNIINSNTKNLNVESTIQEYNWDNNAKPIIHSERNIMFHELKKISGDSYLNSFDINMTFSRRNLRNKKVELNSTEISSTNINSNIDNLNQNNNNNNKDKQSKKKPKSYSNLNNGSKANQIQLELKNTIKLNELNGKYYNEVLKDKTAFYIELKINPEIIYEDSFIEHIVNKRNSQFYSFNNNYNFTEKKLSEAGIAFPEYKSENIINFANHFVLDEIKIEITAINDLLFENVLKLINNCLFSDCLENAIAKSIGVFNEYLKVDFNEITNTIENFYVLDLIHMTNAYFYVGKKNMNLNKLYEIIKKSIKATAPNILEYCPDYLILNKAKFPCLLNNSGNNKENFNSLNLNFLNKEFENVDIYKGKVRNARFANLFREADKKANAKNSKGAKGNNKKATSNNKIKDLYQELEKQLKNKSFDSCLNTNNINFTNYSLEDTNDKNNNKNNEKINIFNDDSQAKCEQIAGIISEGNTYLNELNDKKTHEEKLNELANDTKMLKEILVGFKYNYIDDWAKKLVFVSEDATKCKAYMADKKTHFSHIYSYNKLMSKECRSKIAKILNKTKFKVLAWYSNPKQTKNAGLKNFTFLSKFPMQSTSTEKFHVYVYIKTR